MKKVLIYGVNKQAESLLKMIDTEGQAQVEGFIVDKEYKKKDALLGLPIIEAERVEELFNNNDYEICLSFGYKNMVHNREEKYNWCKSKGYSIFSFISKNALIYSNSIGDGCNIYPGVIIAPHVRVGKGSFIEMGCIISHHSEIGEFNFLAPGVHFCGSVKTGSNCFFGSASEIVNDCYIGKEVFVGASAKVSGNIQDKSAVLPPRGYSVPNASFDIMNRMFK